VYRLLERAICVLLVYTLLLSFILHITFILHTTYYILLLHITYYILHTTYYYCILSLSYIYFFLFFKFMTIIILILIFVLIYSLKVNSWITINSHYLFKLLEVDIINQHTLIEIHHYTTRVKNYFKHVYISYTIFFRYILLILTE